jgi:hypothetical protein
MGSLAKSEIFRPSVTFNALMAFSGNRFCSSVSLLLSTSGLREGPLQAASIKNVASNK